MSGVSGIPVRRPAGEVPTISGLSLEPPGERASLVNISTTGLLAESTARLLAGTLVTVSFAGGFSPSTVTGRVVRSQVSVMGADGQLRYHIAIEFDAPIVLDNDTRDSAVTSAAHIRNRW